ncbi:ribonuclease HII [Candidatus Pantoea edessiphila]|uniref:Ribonuclease HII n=1 Tax=Candidatus Pantoea edessiphila TaxID=2044610 RepID=A0A2P5SXZ3_9GAMM|nr:ribonuclease HII [Candidatus Pantoea edessiphila]MBK4775558.1 ribonuclease HII [Pantoea sp. Edef]PPI87211.1 ribonuclease HII [Candidatus Pantoea edessiphila]
MKRKSDLRVFNCKNKCTLIAGIDEVGRGALVGRVVTAAVIFSPIKTIEGLSDSKKLSERQRILLYDKIIKNSLAWSIGYAEPKEIDKINIFYATMLAMKRAINNLSIVPNYIVVDGNSYPKISIPIEAIVKGDNIIGEISAASIIAKVTRDREMIILDSLYPNYGFAQHKGYPTKNHIKNLKKYGVTPYHRLSFKPVFKAIT